MITIAELPTPMITGPMLDTPGCRRTPRSSEALELADVEGFAREQAGAGRGRCLGLGVATFHEAAPVHPTSSIT
ncbi:MAG: hypothetical protein R2710_29865 [Acidimicrobiales bacterium]